MHGPRDRSHSHPRRAQPWYSVILMNRFRAHTLIVVVAAAVALAILLSHGIRVRLLWGSAGFVAGLVTGVLLTMEIRHRRNQAGK